MVEVTRPSADCQTTFFGRFKQLEKFLKKVAERSRDSGRRSRDRRPTVKQRFLDVSSDLRRGFWEKSRWTVTRRSGSEVTLNADLMSGDCQTTYDFLDEIRRIANGMLTYFEKSSLNAHATFPWGVTRPSADCQTTFFGLFSSDLENFSEGVIVTSNGQATWGMIAIRTLTCTRKCWRTKNQAKKFTRQFFCWLLLHLSRFFTGKSPAPQELCGASSLMFIMGDERVEREETRPSERESNNERETRDGESTLQDHIITMRWELHYIRVYPTIFSCVDPRYQLSRFFTGISRRNNGELISLIGNQRVGIFPPKSEILFVLSLALIWYRNFQDRTIPLGGDTWPCFWRKEGIMRE